MRPASTALTTTQSANPDERTYMRLKPILDNFEHGVFSSMEIAQNKPHFSIPSIIAIVAAIASFFVSPASSFLLAIVAIIFGIFGFVLALAPSVRGGIVSIFSLFLAGIGIVVAIVKALMR